MAIFTLNIERELNDQLTVKQDGGSLIWGNAEANQVVVVITDNGAAVALSGTVEAQMLRADGQTLVWTGNIIDGAAVVTLPASAYAVQGPAELNVDLVDGSQRMTLVVLRMMVDATTSNAEVAPVDTVPNLATLLAKIAEMEAATQAANEAAAAVPAMIATTFSMSTAYVAGQTVYYNGALYRFTANHAAGAWTGADVVQIVLGDEVGGVKSDVNDLKSAITYDEYLINNGTYTIKADMLESGQWSYSTKADNPARARTKNLLPVRAGMKITYANTTFDTYFGVLETPTSPTYIQAGGWKTDGNGTISITKDGWLTFIIRNHADTTANVNPADYDSTVVVSTESRNELHELESAMTQFFTAPSTFSLADMPRDSYTYFSSESVTFEELPSGLATANYVLIKRKANEAGNLSIVYLVGLYSSPKEIYTCYFSETAATPTGEWTKIATLPEVNAVKDVTLTQWIPSSTPFGIDDMPANCKARVTYSAFSDLPEEITGGYINITKRALNTAGTYSLVEVYSSFGEKRICFKTSGSAVEWIGHRVSYTVGSGGSFDTLQHALMALKFLEPFESRVSLTCNDTYSLDSALVIDGHDFSYVTVYSTHKTNGTTDRILYYNADNIETNFVVPARGGYAEVSLACAILAVNRGKSPIFDCHIASTGSASTIAMGALRNGIVTLAPGRHISGITGSSVYIMDGGYGIFNGCTVENCIGNGVNAFRAAHLEMSGAHIISCRIGMYVDSASRADISHTDFTDISNTGLWVGNSSICGAYSVDFVRCAIGAKATGGGKITAYYGVFDTCPVAIQTITGAEIQAPNSRFSGCTALIEAGGGSRVNVADSTVSGGTVSVSESTVNMAGCTASSAISLSMEKSSIVQANGTDFTSSTATNSVSSAGVLTA